MSKQVSMRQLGCVCIIIIIAWGTIGINRLRETFALQDAKKTSDRAKVPVFSSDFDALAAQIERSEPDVSKVDRYDVSSEFSGDTPLETYFTIYLKKDVRCGRAKSIAEKYYPKLVAVRAKYLPSDDAKTCSVDVNDDGGHSVASRSSDGIHEGKYCSE